MAQPAVADVRVSCPACGGPIHPIAGRCKHCRADLVAARGGATGAAGTMIHVGTVARSAPKAGAAPLVTPAPGPAALRPGLPSPGQPVPALVAAVKPARGGWGKRWPLLVAAVAGVAILASVAVLLLGGDGKKARPRRVLGPAPDRMQTDDLPTDPWARGSNTPDPSNGQLLPPAAVPDLNPSRDDPAPPTHDPVDDDTLGGVAGGVLGGVDPGAPATDTAEQFLRSAIEVTCKRLSACWGDATATSMCEQGRTLLDTQRDAVSTLCPRVNAAAAGQCLRQLATLPCPDQAASMDELASMAYGLDPCMRACER